MQAAHYVLLGSCRTAWKRITRSDALRNFIERCTEGFGTRGKVEPEMRRQIAKQRRRLTTAVRLAEGDTCKNF